MSKREDVLGLQYLLRSQGQKITADGLLGPMTRSAVQKVSGAMANAIKSLSDLIDKPINVADDRWLSTSAVEKIVAQELRVESADLNVDTMMKMLMLEANQKKIGGVVHHDVRSSSLGARNVGNMGRGFHGLFQMGGGAWSDVQKQDGSIGPWNALNAYDPVKNTRAAIGYTRINISQLRRGIRNGAESYPAWTGAITPEIIYGMHNQGALGFARLVWKRERTSNFLGQSNSAKQSIVRAMNQMGSAFA